MKDTFLIVDGNSLLHRAFHALPLMDADGVYTNAVFGFMSMLLKALDDEKPAYLAVCFDETGPPSATRPTRSTRRGGPPRPRS